MRFTILAAAAALALLTACNKGPDSRADKSPASSGTSSAAPAQSNTPSTPANVGRPSQAEKREGANTQQGQVDPKQPEQHRDFQQKGDGAGPQGPDTQPRR